MRMLGDDPQVERWRNVAVGLILAAVVLAATYTYAYAHGRDANTRSVTNATEAATYFEAMADSAWTLVAERQGLSSESVRICMAGALAERMADAGVGS